MIIDHPYAGRRASLATRHGKLNQIAPIMMEKLSLDVVEVDVDTDSLGTFAGEVPRLGSPRDTVVAKAKLGMSESGSSLGIASEGTIGPHPDVPFLVSDMEIVVLVDDDLGTTVVEFEVEFGIPTLAVDVEVERWDDIPLGSAGFPEHGLIVRPTSGLYPIFKGIHNLEDLRHAVFECGRRSESMMVHIESDLRAHHHPSRQRVIARAAEKLAQRLSCLCPACGTPGWGVGRREGGAPCSLCGAKTRQVLFEHLECPSCDFTDKYDVSPGEGIDPALCPRCNP